VEIVLLQKEQKNILVFWGAPPACRLTAINNTAKWVVRFGLRDLGKTRYHYREQLAVLFLTFHELPPSTRGHALSRQLSLILFSLGANSHIICK
jgi:hypothetical protein